MPDGAPTRFRPESEGHPFMRLLLAAGADPNRGGLGVRYSPLHQAASRGHLENVRLLLQAGGKPSVGDNGWWPLHEVFRNSLGDKEKTVGALIDLLVGAGNPIDAQDDKGATPLHMAAEDGSAFAVAALLSRKASVNIADKCGLTPLAYSLRPSEDRALAVAELLINARANVNVMDTCERESLLEKVDKAGYARLRQLLVAKGARKMLN